MNVEWSTLNGVQTESSIENAEWMCIEMSFNENLTSS